MHTPSNNFDFRAMTDSSHRADSDWQRCCAEFFDAHTVRPVLHHAYFGSTINLLVHCHQYLLPHRAQLVAFVEVDPWKRPHEAWVVHNTTRYCEHCSAGVAAAACRHLHLLPRRMNPYLRPAAAAYLVAWLVVAVVKFAFVASVVETFASAAAVGTFAFAKIVVAAAFDFAVAAVALAFLAYLAAVEAFFAAGVALEVVNIAAPAAVLEQRSKTAP